MAEVGVAAHVQGHPDAYCPASGAARTSVRGAGIECDKQRRQGMRRDEGKAISFMRHRGGNPSIPLPAAPIEVRAFCHGRAKNQTMTLACPAIRGKTFPKVNYLTLLDRFLNDAA
jgi:hypothetical protein